MERGRGDVGALQMSLQMVPRPPLRSGRGPGTPGSLGLAALPQLGASVHVQERRCLWRGSVCVPRLC